MARRIGAMIGIALILILDAVLALAVYEHHGSSTHDDDEPTVMAVLEEPA